MKYLFLIFAICLAFAFKGCVKMQGVQKVYIPTRCDIPARERPTYNLNMSTAQNLSEILKYTELLESDVNFCRNGE